MSLCVPSSIQPLAQPLQKHLFGTTTTVLQPCAFDSEHSILSFSYAMKWKDSAKMQWDNEFRITNVSVMLQPSCPQSHLWVLTNDVREVWPNWVMGERRISGKISSVWFSHTEQIHHCFHRFQKKQISSNLWWNHKSFQEVQENTGHLSFSTVIGMTRE